MRDTLSYKAIVGGQEVTVTRHQPSDGRGFTDRLDDAGKPKRKKVKHKPVDDQLHALDMLLASAKESGDDGIIEDVENSINRRIKELTGE